MSEILDLQGRKAVPAATDVKKAHDSKELAQEAQRVNGLFKQWAQAAVTDLNRKDDAGKLVDLDTDKVIDHYATFFEKEADILNSSGFPHQVDRGRLRRELKGYVQEMELGVLAKKPLREVVESGSMEHFKLYESGVLPMGRLWLNSHMAVAIDPYGLTTVWLRGANEPLEDWAEAWAVTGQPHWIPPVAVGIDYTLVELQGFLVAKRETAVTRIPDALMKPRKVEQASFWSKLFGTRA
jgi:hypothetical protein